MAKLVISEILLTNIELLTREITKLNMPFHQPDSEALHFEAPNNAGATNCFSNGVLARLSILSLGSLRFAASMFGLRCTLASRFNFGGHSLSYRELFIDPAEFALMLGFVPPFAVEENKQLWRASRQTVKTRGAVKANTIRVHDRVR
ncbi:MAG: hypothetical protein EON58_14300 [Alphaproteobacteria bacterium]|nr:MAG: hypothetical protein EON58_14300 [Alphaproteobacteria bacterium]